MSDTLFEIIRINETPNGEWKYLEERTGTQFQNYSYEALKRDIKSHLRANDLPVPIDWEEAMQDKMCRQNPHWGRLCQKVGTTHQKLRPLTFAMAIGFLDMMMEWAKTDKKFVDQDEAERRASICAICPQNKPVSFNCGSCQNRFLNLVANLRGKKKTEHDKELGGCRICGCSLKASVHFPLEIQQKNLTETMKAEFLNMPDCWKREGLKLETPEKQENE